MRGYLLKSFEDLKASYWAIPGAMILLALLLATLTRQADEALGWEALEGVGLLTVTTVDGARSVLSVIAGAAIGVAGTTFSITIVAVSYASGQFGPRLIGNFMRDRGNQLTLGVFIATHVFALTVLSSVSGEIEVAQASESGLDAFVPHLSVFVAMVFALASVGVLIYFIHHVPESIDVGRLTAEIGRSLRAAAGHLYPEGRAAPVPLPDVGNAFEGFVEGRTGQAVPARNDGYLQALDTARLAEIAEAEDLYLNLGLRPGDFATDHDRLMTVYPAPERDRLSDDVIEKLHGAFAHGRQRTTQQNLLFHIDQLSEIIIKALSPGINDPFTAINAFQWLRAGISDLAKAEEGGAVLLEGGRVLTHRLTFGEVLAAAFDQTRPYVATDRNVALHTLGVLRAIEAACPDRERRAAIAQKRDLLVEAVEAIEPPVPWLGELHDRAAEGFPMRARAGGGSRSERLVPL